MSMRCLLAGLLALAVTSETRAASVSDPAPGLWVHPGDGGRSFNIDLQGDRMVVTTILYRQDGAPLWYLSSGIYLHATGLFRSSYDGYSGGQCFGCPPTAPTVHPAAAGPMEIRFHSGESATIVTPEGPLDIVKFNYGFGSRDDLLFGAWAFSVLSRNGDGSAGGDWVVFDHTAVDDMQRTYIAGHREGSPIDYAYGYYSEALQQHVVIVTQTDGSWHTYRLTLDDRRGRGFAWGHRSGQEPVGDGFQALAVRRLFRSELVWDAAGTAGAGAALPASAPSPSPQPSHVPAGIARLRTAMPGIADAGSGQE